MTVQLLTRPGDYIADGLPQPQQFTYERGVEVFLLTTGATGTIAVRDARRNSWGELEHRYLVNGTWTTENHFCHPEFADMPRAGWEIEFFGLAHAVRRPAAPDADTLAYVDTLTPGSQLHTMHLAETIDCPACGAGSGRPCLMGGFGGTLHPRRALAVRDMPATEARLTIACLFTARRAAIASL